MKGSSPEQNPVTALDLIPQVPRCYQYIEHPYTGRQYAFGDEVTDLITAAVARGYLVVPYRDTAAAVRLANTYWQVCVERQFPYVVVEINKDGRGQIFWNLEPLGPPLAAAPYELLACELGWYNSSLGDRAVALKGKRHVWQIEPLGGWVAFPAGRWDPIALVLDYVKEHCAQVWRSQAPSSEAPE